jgi:hypothetical protein
MWHVHNFVLVAMCVALCGQTAKRLHQVPAVVGFPLAVHQDVVQVRGGLFNTAECPVDEPLKGVSGIPQAEGHAGVLEQAERCDDGSLGDVGGVHGFLVVPLLQVDPGKMGAPCCPVTLLRRR